MQREAMLIQLGYTPNEALVKQIGEIIENTTEYGKIEKHIMDLHNHLKVNNAYVAMSNSSNHFKIKIESPTAELAEEAHEKVARFSEKFKVSVQKLEKRETYYILGFEE